MAISLLLNTIMATLAVIRRLWDIVTPSQSSIKQQLPPIIVEAEEASHQKQQPFPMPDRPQNVHFFSITKTNVSNPLWQN